MRDAGGNRVYVTFRELVERTMGATLTRADLHISRSRDGELFLTSRQDGMIRMLVADGRTGGDAVVGAAFRRPMVGPTEAGPHVLHSGAGEQLRHRVGIDRLGEVGVEARLERALLVLRLPQPVTATRHDVPQRRHAAGCAGTLRSRPSPACRCR